MNEGPRENSFDALAKELASGAISRRRALRLMGTAILGGTLASIPGVAWAAHRGTPHGGGNPLAENAPPVRVEAPAHGPVVQHQRHPVEVVRRWSGRGLDEAALAHLSSAPR